VAQFEFFHLLRGHPELAKDLERSGYAPTPQFDGAREDPSGLKSFRMTPV
jgi:hypothetical protein